MKRVLLFSGGIDSTTRLYELVSTGKGSNLVALSIFESSQWGGQMSPETIAATKLADELGVRHVVHDVSRTKELFAAVPHGAFAAGGQMGGCCSRQQEYAPMSVSMMLLSACMFAASEKASVLEWTLNADDVPDDDSRRNIAKLVNAMQCVVEAEGYQVQLQLPYRDCSKRDVVFLARELGVPLERTMSCLDASAGVPCGICQQCIACEQAIQQGCRMPLSA